MTNLKNSNNTKTPEYSNRAPKKITT